MKDMFSQSDLFPADPAGDEIIPSADRAEIENLGRSIPPDIRFGTSTWTYPGWSGLVYHRNYPKNGAAARMLEEYARFPLFRTVGIDSSFYRPPSINTLKTYAKALPVGFPCVSKVWDQITVHTHTAVREQGRAGEQNPDFLNAELFLQEMYDPYQEHFGGHAGPFVFEFQAIGRNQGMSPQTFADRLDQFFGKLPREGKYAVEVRNEEFLTSPYFAVLREHGVAHVYNSWTRMPSIGDQLALPESLTTSFVVARVLLRPGRTYEEAVDAFAPYDRIREPNPELRADVIALVNRARSLRIPAYILVNNRAEGSAPNTIIEIVRGLEEERGET
ncbi:MAG: DUF72 domain-containing protein [Gemmatimonadota bacterium]